MKPVIQCIAIFVYACFHTGNFQNNCDFSMSKFGPNGLWGKHFEISSHTPHYVIQPSLSTLHCAQLCAQEDWCLSFVRSASAQTCKLYDKLPSVGTSIVYSSNAAYLERRGSASSSLSSICGRSKSSNELTSMESTPPTTTVGIPVSTGQATVQITEDPTTVQTSESTTVQTTADPTTVQTSESTTVQTTADPTTVQTSESTTVQTTADPTTVQTSESTVPSTEDPTTVPTSESFSIIHTTKIQTFIVRTSDITTTSAKMHTTEEVTTPSLGQVIFHSTNDHSTVATSEDTAAATMLPTTEGQTTVHSSFILSTKVPGFQYPNCGSAPPCTELAPTAAFRHRDGTYIILDGTDYWVFNSIEDMCYGQPASGPSNFDDLAEGFQWEPDMAATINNGEDLYVFRKPKVYCFKYNMASRTYQTCDSWDKDNVNNVFGSNMDPSIRGECFIAENHTHGYMFDGSDVLFSDVGSWSMLDSDPTNPFYMTNPGATCEACTDTPDPNIFMFFESANMYIYNAPQRQGTYIGKCCTGP